MDLSILEPTPANVANILYETAKECKVQPFEENQQVISGHDKWKHIMQSNDSKKLWKAINRKGEIGSDQSEKPDDKSFKSYFEDLLNPDKIEYADMPTVTNVIHIPVLDDPITPVEVKDVG